MSDSSVPYQNPTTTDGLLDCESLTVAAQTVKRERIQVAGAVDVALASVVNAAPTTEYGLVTRNIPSGTQAISAANLDVTLSSRLSTLGQKAMASSAPMVIASDQSAIPASQSGTWNIGTVTNLDVALSTRLSETDFDSKTGILTEAAPASDTASSGLNGRLQRIAQRITSLMALLPAALVGGRLDVNIGASAATVTVSGTVTTAPPTNASTNVAQFGGTNISTGTGIGGVGIPRITISNDSSLAANQSVNVAQMGGIATSMNTGVRDTGTQRVTVATNDLVPISAASLPLPTGAATETTLATLMLDATFTGRHPVGANPADGQSNAQATTYIKVLPSVFNGSGWDRLKGDSTNGAFVNVKTSVIPTGAATEATLATLATLDRQVQAQRINELIFLTAQGSYLNDLSGAYGYEMR